ncbi:MAG: hypothetical protein ACRCWB_11585 [Enterovibrio sp.]
MLNNIPRGVLKMARNVIMNHPNAFNFELYRRKNLREDSEGEIEVGGMTVLSAEDEHEIVWNFVGFGFAIPAEAFGSASGLNEREDYAFNGLEEFRFLLEPEARLGDEGGFDIKKGDVFYVRIGSDEDMIKIGHEIIGIESNIHIPPYTERYITNRRADLDVRAEPIKE